MPDKKEIDRKYRISAVSRSSNRSHDETDSVLFLAKDRAFAMTLPAYIENCKKVGAGPEQIRAAELLLERVKRYQALHRHEVKIPDVDPIKEAYVLKS